VKKVVDEMLRPEISLNAQESDAEHEAWYNSQESRRRSFRRTYSYSADVKCYDRSQEHVALKLELEFYRRLGLSRERLEIWERTHGVKTAISMMYGVMISVVLSGVSGIFKTLFRNGLINLAALLWATQVKREEIVVLDIKGDDSDLETSILLKVETAVSRMALTLNLSSKFFTSDVRYMCKSFRIRKFGRWFFVPDPWARVQSVCTPLWIERHDDSLSERWVSLVDDLRHYDNSIILDEVAVAAAQYYGLKFIPNGMVLGLAALRASKDEYMRFFLPAELVN